MNFPADRSATSIMVRDPIVDCADTARRLAAYSALKKLIFNSWNKNVESLDFLSAVPQLEELVLQGFPRLKDASTLAHLKNLRVLRIGDGMRFALNVLPSLPKLERLAITATNAITDRDAIGACAGLKYLLLDNFVMGDLHALSDLQNLERLKLTRGYIVSMRGLEKCRAIEHLWVDATKTEDFAALRDTDSLQFISISKCRAFCALDSLHGFRGRGLYLYEIPKIESLAPIAESELLWQFHFIGTIADKDVLPLFSMPALKICNLALRYKPRIQKARRSSNCIFSCGDRQWFRMTEDGVAAVSSSEAEATYQEIEAARGGATGF